MGKKRNNGFSTQPWGHPAFMIVNVLQKMFPKLMDFGLPVWKFMIYFQKEVCSPSTLSLSVSVDEIMVLKAE